ncbi:hypothetical protein L7F22_034234 [Adiantum nelumboides]|nr:hypothetical protein [Adiantum nelumboides]
MLTACGRPHSYWEEAISTACYLQNCIFTTALPNQTPYFRWFGHKPDLSHTRIFGCDAYAVSTDPHRGKLDHKAISTIFVGYGERFGYKAYRLYDPIGRRFLFSRSVIFDELQLLKGDIATFSPTLTSPIYSIHAHDSTPFTKSSSIPLSQPNSNLLHNPSLPLLPLPSPSSSANDSQNSTFELPTSPSLQASSSSNPWPTPSPPCMMRSLADIYAQTNAISCTPPVEPKFSYPLLVDDGVTLNEALSGPKAHLWKATMDQEMAALHANKTWTLASLPPGRQPISCKWIFLYKLKSDGSIDRYKARLVAQRFFQKPSLDYSETFSPVLSMTSFWVIVALAAHYQFHLHQLDIKTAFLHAHGYSRLQTDSTIYTRHTSESILVLAVYVDDIPIMSDKEDVLIASKKELSQAFPLTDGGPISYCLGLLVQQDYQKATISLSQSRYVAKVLQRFNLSSCKGVDIPLTPSVKLISEMMPLTPNEQEQMAAIPYMPAIGGIRYLVTCTRSDICFTAGYLSWFMQDPCLPYWKHHKHLLCYIKATQDLCLVFFAASHSDSPMLHGWCDADWGGNLDNCKSTTRYVFTLAGGAISWYSKIQTCVSLSTTEAEYIATATAATEGIWLQRLLQELKIYQPKPFTLYSDNQSCIYLARNKKQSGKTKHFDVKYHFIRDNIEDNQLHFAYTSTSEMWADFLTKPVPKLKHEECSLVIDLQKAQA